jgi:hypothetical protein
VILNSEQRRAFETWRAVGLSESAAMNALIEDGVITLSEDEHLAQRFQDTFGLSEEAAQIAAAGRQGAPHSPVSEVAGRPAAGPKPGDNDRLIRIIEAWAQDLRAHGQLCVERGESRELAALREAYGKVLLRAENDVQAMWVIRVAEARWPELSVRPGSSRSGHSGSSARTSGSVCG